MRNACRIKACLNSAGAFLAKPSSLEPFRGMRSEAGGCTSDQGAKKGITDGSFNVIEACVGEFVATDPGYSMYPRCLFVFGHHHILFDSLEETTKSLPNSARFSDKLNICHAFLSDRHLRQQFQATCVQGKPCLGTLSSQTANRLATGGPQQGVGRARPSIPDLKEHFNLQAIVTTPTWVLKRRAEQEVEKALRMPAFVEVREVFRVAGKQSSG